MKKRNRCIISGIAPYRISFGCNKESFEYRRTNVLLRNTIGTLHGHGVDEFYIDGSYGFPIWGGQIVISLMNDNDIMLYVAVPHENQAFCYTEEWRNEYYDVHRDCTQTIPIYLDFDIDGNREFLKEEYVMFERAAADFMLRECGRLIFCGEPESDLPDSQGCYIYEQAVELGLKITKVALPSI
ncbi:MAG: SLOG family protein [Oscillospiraceae bacterium]|nr:SLOG family protein [Oscillospiraceae bacterium]